MNSISDAPRVALTDRQRTVLRLLCAGATDRQIAAQVRTSTRTVQREIARVRAALGAPSRTAMIASALRAAAVEAAGTGPQGKPPVPRGVGRPVAGLVRKAGCGQPGGGPGRSSSGGTASASVR